jgi:DNA adenine methylase
MLEIEETAIAKKVYHPPKVQLLKWVGSKHKFAEKMSAFFPEHFNDYHEPFVGSGSILATIAPKNGFASDIYQPLVEIWQTLKDDPELLIEWYEHRLKRLDSEDKKAVYESIKASFNTNPTGADFLYLTRACWGGVIRFRKLDGYMSTPIGYHDPISTNSFKLRVYDWHERIKNTTFSCIDYKEAFEKAKSGDFIFCDPPYKYSQSILYGSQDFRLEELLECIRIAKLRGIYVAMSIDGNSKSGRAQQNLNIPVGIFEREVNINDRFSMLLRFKRVGQTLTTERDNEKLFLTY